MITAKDLKLDQTCVSCPEQYNVYYHGQQIGYIRRQWDHIWVYCPNVFGEIVYEAPGYLDNAGLDIAVDAIVDWFSKT